jgi:hypothetical protein
MFGERLAGLAMYDSTKGARIKKTARIALYVVIALCVLELLTYVLFADSAMVGTVVDYFPQKIHFSEDTTFEFVCVSTETWSSLSEGQQETLRSTLQKHHEQVYVGLDEVPDERKWFEKDASGSKTLIGLKGGWLLEWEVELHWPFYFKATYSDYEGNLAASIGSGGYLWLFGFWVRVWSGPRAIS